MIQQPIATDFLDSPDHSLSHRIFANDDAAPVKSIVVDALGNIGIGTETPNQKLTIEGSMSLKEQAAAGSSTPAYGQIWIKTGTPNELWFTNDTGNDFKIATLTGTETFTNKTIKSSTNKLGGVTMEIGSDANGDIYYRSGNVLTRLAKGAALQILSMDANGDFPEWIDAAGGDGDPQFIAGGIQGASNFFYIYTDDLDNVGYYANSASGTIRLSVRSISHDNKYVSGNRQTINMTAIWGSATVHLGAMVREGFIYILISDGAAQRVYRASTSADISQSGNWTQLTIAGTAFGTGDRFIGYGNGAFWIADGSSEFRPYTLSGTTLTSGTPVNVTGASYNALSSRINDDAIYAHFSGGPFIRVANFAGALSGVQSQVTLVSSPFVIPTSFYVVVEDSGGAQKTGVSKVY